MLVLIAKHITFNWCMASIYFSVETKKLDDIKNDDNKALIKEIKKTLMRSPSDRPTMETVSAAVGMLSIHSVRF